MRLNDITPEAVATVLQALRCAAPPPASPLLSLDLVTHLLEERGIHDSIPARFQLLGDILRRLVWNELARLRPPAEHVDDPDSITEPIELRLLQADCRCLNDDRAAWGALYFQYLGINRIALTTLGKDGIPYYTFRRRRRHGCALLATRLLQLEIRGGITSPMRGHANPYPAAGRPLPPRQPDAVQASPVGHRDRMDLAAPSRDSHVPEGPSARRYRVLGLLVLATLAMAAVSDPGAGTVPAPDCLLLVSGPDLQPPSPRVGQAFTITLSIRNNSNDVLHLQKLMVGVRDAAMPQVAWRSPTVFMPTEHDLTLEPGATYVYRKTRIAREEEAGQHLIAPAVQQEGAWSGLWPFKVAWVPIRAK